MVWDADKNEHPSKITPTPLGTSLGAPRSGGGGAPKGIRGPAAPRHPRMRCDGTLVMSSGSGGCAFRRRGSQATTWLFLKGRFTSNSAVRRVLALGGRRELYRGCREEHELLSLGHGSRKTLSSDAPSCPPHGTHSHVVLHVRLAQWRSFMGSGLRGLSNAVSSHDM